MSVNKGDSVLVDTAAAGRTIEAVVLYVPQRDGQEKQLYILLYAHSICECHSRGCHTVSRMELVPYGRFYDTRSG